jgi:hypothetical protein
MPVFISYSHADEVIVNKLALHLVKNNAHVWVDKWELSVGESIINRVQEAIQESSALLVILSKASVVSEWCKKELSAGLIRELEEKRVVVLPVLIEDCEIPIFLRDKLYADLRKDFDDGLHHILGTIAKITNSYQSRLERDDGYIDWAEDWGFNNELFHLRYTMVESFKSLPMTLITQVHIFCNDVATNRYKQYEAAGLDWIGRALLSEWLFELGEKKNFQLILDSQFPKKQEVTIGDPKINFMLDVNIESRKLGQDSGKDHLVHLNEYLCGIRDYVRSVSREPTTEEIQQMQEIKASPFKP